MNFASLKGNRFVLKELLQCPVHCRENDDATDPDFWGMIACSNNSGAQVFVEKRCNHKQNIVELIPERNSIIIALYILTNAVGVLSSEGNDGLSLPKLHIHLQEVA